MSPQALQGRCLKGASGFEATGIEQRVVQALLAGEHVLTENQLYGDIVIRLKKGDHIGSCLHLACKDPPVPWKETQTAQESKSSVGQMKVCLTIIATFVTLHANLQLEIRTFNGTLLVPKQSS